MPSENEETVWPEDLRTTASVCRRAFEPFVDPRWDGPAGELEWSCRTTLLHVLTPLLYYAINLAPRSSKPWFSGKADPSLPVPELLEALEGRAVVLAEACAAAPLGAREAHDWGMGTPRREHGKNHDAPGQVV
jgi:hypothetical protein